MHQATTILRVLADLSVLAGIAPDVKSAQALIVAKFSEHSGDPDLAARAFPSEASALDECPSCPFREPARRAALDGIAGAFLQISEHMELLAEPPRRRMAIPPLQERAAAPQGPAPA